MGANVLKAIFVIDMEVILYSSDDRVMLERSASSGPPWGVPKKFYTGRLRPKVPPLTLLYGPFLAQKRYPFRIPSPGK